MMKGREKSAKGGIQSDRHSLHRQHPEVGTVCPNWARTDLCGGRSAMGVPTPIRNRVMPCRARAADHPDDATLPGLGRSAALAAFSIPPNLTNARDSP